MTDALVRLLGLPRPDRRAALAEHDGVVSLGGLYADPIGAMRRVFGRVGVSA